MDREILFRGKRVDDGELVISDSLMQVKGQNPRLWVEFDGWVEVLPETVGQFTGLTDKNGKKIFEGDIVRYETIAHNGYEGIYKVVFEDRNGCGYFGIAYSDIETCVFCYSTPASQMEIIGNLYDNPKLLRSENG